MGATTTEDLTMTVTGPDGKTSGPISVNDLDRASERLRADAGQLTFNLGTGRADNPDFATVKIAGQLAISQDLLYGQHVTVTITDHHGEVLAEGPAAVGYPAFKDHYDKHGGKTVERVHTATIE